MNLIHHVPGRSNVLGWRTKLQVLKKVIEESSHVVHLILFLRTSLAVVACSRSGPVLAAYTITRCGDTFRNLKEVVILYGLRGRVGAALAGCGPASGSCKEAKSRLCAAVHDRPSAPLIAAL